MPDLTFAKPRHEYDSYRDFWSLVKVSGYPVCWIDEMDFHDASKVYIFTGPDASNEFKGAKARIIYWLLEWYGDYYQREGVAETWVCNETYASMVNARYVPMGGHPDLGTLDRGTPEWDISHMSDHRFYRRGNLLNNIRALGVTISPNGWFWERDYILRHTELMLHIHQNGDYPALAPLRAVLAAAYGLPLISENGWSLEPYTDYISYGDYRHLPRLVMQMLSTNDLQERGKAFHHYVCNELRFKNIVEAAL